MKTPLCASFLVCLTGLAGAQTSGEAERPAYLGFGIGPLHSESMEGAAITPALQAQGLTVRTTSVEDRSTGWKLYAGYRLDRHLAIEGGYTSLGRFRYEGQIVEDPGSVQATFKAGDWNVAARAILPLGERFEVFGKAGIGYWRTELDAQGRFSGRGAKPADAHGVSPIWGLGAGWRFSDQVSARLDWERFLRVGKSDITGRADIDFTSLGLLFNF